MKLLTFNLHSRPDDAGKEKTTSFAEFLLHEQPDVVALQEVNQSCGAPAAGPELLKKSGYYPISGIEELPAVGEDNVALRIADVLVAHGSQYHWLWLPIKQGYGQFDEGVALFLRRPVEMVDTLWLSTCQEYQNWRTRRALGVFSDGVWYYSLHMGRWDDREEPFVLQWRRLQEHLSFQTRVVLMGDFNCPAGERDGGYDRMLLDGWLDMHTLAARRLGEETAQGMIDGWDDRTIVLPLRIDYIFTNRSCEVSLCETVFDGFKQPKISDHCGVMSYVSFPERGGTQ